MKNIFENIKRLFKRFVAWLEFGNNCQLFFGGSCLFCGFWLLFDLSIESYVSVYLFVGALIIFLLENRFLFWFCFFLNLFFLFFMSAAYVF